MTSAEVESNSNMRVIFDISPYAMLIITNGVFIDANKAALRIFNAKTPDDIIGKPPAILSPPVQPNGRLSDEYAGEIIKRALSGSHEIFEWEHQTLDKKPFFARVNLKLFEYLGNQSLMVAFEDITSQKIKEAELQASQNNLQIIFDSTPYAMLVITDGVFVQANAAAVHLFGAKSKEYFNGKPPGILSPKFQKDGIPSEKLAPDKINQAMSGDVVSFDWAHQKIDGTIIDCHVTLAGIQYNGKPSLMTVIQDLTHQKKALSDIINVIQTAKGGDLTARTNEKEYSGDFFEICNGINQMLDIFTSPLRLFQTKISSIVSNTEEVNASVEQVTGGTGLLAENSNVLSKNAEDGEEGVKQILGAMEDLSVTVSNLAVSSQNIAQMSTSAEEMGIAGIHLVQNTEKAMAEITKSSENVDSIVLDIKNQMDQIGKIVNLISDIANQTNLLALNAAIEAARAGEAGRGFAVVASEVKSLAQESRQSAENISDMIRNLQEKSHKAAEAVSYSTENVIKGNQTLSETIKVFDSNVESIKNISQKVTDMASISEEQAASVEQITANVNEVAKILSGTLRQSLDSSAATEEISSSLSQISHSMHSVTRDVEEISSEMIQFKF
jgi:methyl-accepting chemotaxis protein